jgi:predicted nucleic acid-binding protein
VAVRLLDTNIVSYQVKALPLAAVYHPHLLGHTLAVSFQTVAELLEGAAAAKWGPAKRRVLTTTLGRLLVFHSDQTTCERWAEIRAVRRAQPIGVADAWIAATALTYGVELVTHNPSDFAGTPGLSIITEAP